MLQTLEQAIRFNQALPDRIRRYLIEGRGISNDVIDAFLLGWTGTRIAIPIFDRDNNVAFFKFARDPEDTSGSPKMLSPSGSHAELYGWERVLTRPNMLAICEGEFDRLMLESRGIPAVTSTAGAGTFHTAWAAEFTGIREVYAIFDNDAAGQAGAERVATLIPHARIAHLPPEVEEGGDVTDYFVRLKKSREEFLELLAGAKPLPQPPDPPPVIVWHRGRESVDALKAKVLLTELAHRYVDVRPAGRHLLARCPFHDDHHPSFVIYPDSQRYFCFACHAGGDVIAFLMKIEKVGFPEALKRLNNLSAHG
jgi:DNA primase